MRFLLFSLSQHPINKIIKPLLSDVHQKPDLTVLGVSLKDFIISHHFWQQNGRSGSKMCQKLSNIVVPLRFLFFSSRVHHHHLHSRHNQIRLINHSNHAVWSSGLWKICKKNKIKSRTGYFVNLYRHFYRLGWLNLPQYCTSLVPPESTLHLDRDQMLCSGKK